MRFKIGDQVYDRIEDGVGVIKEEHYNSKKSRFPRWLVGSLGNW